MDFAVAQAWILLAVVIITFPLVRRYGGVLRSCVIDLLSKTLNLWLRLTYPIKHVEDGSPLPSEPYRFPNGQGDAAKFLHGKENSEIWGAKHGPIYRIWSGMKPEIVLTRPEHIREVFKDSDKHIKAVNNNSGYFFGELLGQCVGLVSGGKWKVLRAASEHVFLRPAATASVPLIERSTARHFADLLAAPASRLAHGLIDPAEDLKLLPFWVVAEMIYGGSPDGTGLDPQTKAELLILVPQREALFRHVLAGGLPRWSWSKYLPTAANRELQAFKTAWRAFNERARDRALAACASDADSPSSPPSPPPIVDLYEAVRVGTISDAEAILHTLDEVLFANLDVTLGGISWNLVFLAAYRDTQDRLRDEIAAARTAAAASADSRSPASTFRDYLVSSSTFLAACIAESSRLRPLAAFSVPQAAPTARVVGGYLFPAGTSFVVDAYALNQRNPFWGWGPDAKGKEDDDKGMAASRQYRPERFLDSRCGPLQARYNFWRFGFGPRQCMGKYVADLIMRVLLVHLLENYDLGIVLPKTNGSVATDAVDRDPENWINHPQTQLRCELRGA